MTNEEIEVFRNTIADTIMPAANNMTKEQIKNLIDKIVKENPQLQTGFGNMIFEQILIMKYNNQNNN